MTAFSTLTYDHTILDRFPHLATSVLVAEVEVDRLAGVDLEPWLTQARASVADRSESDLEPVRAWRAAFAAMGLKPTRYRCASEALLRRLRTSGHLPMVNPLVDLCNAVSAAHALPVAAFDLARVDGPIDVRPATGDECYLAFSGEHESPDAGEVIFADRAGHAHARRWTHRQSARSAVVTTTRHVLFVCEGHHATAADDTYLALSEIATQIGGTPVDVAPG